MLNIMILRIEEQIQGLDLNRNKQIARELTELARKEKEEKEMKERNERMKRNKEKWESKDSLPVGPQLVKAAHKTPESPRHATDRKDSRGFSKGSLDSSEQDTLKSSDETTTHYK